MKKILIVDDEPDICFFVKKVLERTGKYQVLSSTIPEDAVNICRREKPDLLLLDIVMPHMKGTEIIRQIKSDPDASRMIVVVTSGQGEMVYEEHHDKWRWLPNRPIVRERGDDIIRERSAERASKAYGVDDYLAKPFSPETLLRVMEEVFARAEGRPRDAGND